MSSQFGEFEKNIQSLKDDLSCVRSSWTDKTASTYDVINDNIEVLATRIWERLVDSQNGYNALKSRYDSDDIDKRIILLADEIEQV